MSDESRLSQIEKLLETSAKMIVRHDKMVEQHDQEIADLRELTSRNAEQIERNTQNIAQVFDLCVESIKVMREMQNEVRGIQTENQRVLRHLFGDD